jgi:NADP-dependent 3-hydroxy acid dehydrogenase YdfG
VDIAGTVCIVTGASSGIGETMARLLSGTRGRTVDSYGRIDVPVNDAGQDLHVPLEDLV